jgi:formylmethanofuran:tetrahydromethanopterin formyltransferase
MSMPLQKTPPSSIYAFSGVGAAILITHFDRPYLERTVIEFCAGLGIPYGKSEAGLACWIQSGPDERFGAVCTVWMPGQDDNAFKNLEKELIRRIRLVLLPKLGIRIFSWTPNPSNVFSVEPYFSDFTAGFHELIKEYGRNLLRIPRTGGDLFIDQQIGIQSGIMGGSLLVSFNSGNSAIQFESLIRSISDPIAFTTLIFGLIASGSIPYQTKDRTISRSNFDLCPSMKENRDEPGKIPLDVNFICEIIVNGFELTAMTKFFHELVHLCIETSEVIQITSGNFDAPFNSIQIPLGIVVEKKTN